jgi:hypothetical protein
LKLIIDGREYPAVDHNSGQLLHLMELQQQGRDLVEGGLGMSALQRMEREARVYVRQLKAYEAAREAYEAALEAGQEAEEPEEPIVPDVSLTLMAVAVFLTRRAAGDVVSFRDSLAVGMDTIVQLPEPTDRPASEDRPDPTTPGSGGPATPDDDAPAAAATPPARSKTSKSRSASGSPSSPTGGRKSGRGTSSSSP